MHTDWTIYSSLIGAGLVLLLPREAKNLIRWVALLTGLVGLTVALRDYFHYDAIVTGLVAETGSGFVHLRDVPWITALHSRYHLAVDGISLPLVVLNGFVCVTGILFSWNIEIGRAHV